MYVLAIIVGIGLVFAVLQDSFEAIILPRRVSSRFRLSRWFYISSWRLWKVGGRRIHNSNRRELYLGYFGPLSLILLLIAWATILTLAFALIQWGLNLPVKAPEGQPDFGGYLYFSGVTFVTLGFGDVTPLSDMGRLVAVLEAGTGFGFLALIIGYVPVIYQAFSRRELQIALMDARGGTPPTATELLRRHFRTQQIEELVTYLREWERWGADVLESHLSYPVLTYYRSQHDRQSWLEALTAILDTCSLLIVGFEGIKTPTARFTFAIARHAAVDLAQVYGTTPKMTKSHRMTEGEFQRMRDALAEVGLRLEHGEEAEARLADLRRTYEPFITALAEHLMVTLPPWIASERTVDDWQTSAWDHFAQWSPERLEEITHIIIDHRKKMPLAERKPSGTEGVRQ